MAMELGPVAPVPPPPPSLSRYRRLRGKSVSSPPPFDIFGDNSNDDESNVNQGSSSYSTSPSIRRRSKSVTNPRPGPGGTTAGAAASSTRQLWPSDVRQVHISPHSPELVNVTIKLSLTALEGLKSPIDSVKETLLKAATNNNSANKRTAAATATAPEQQHENDEAPPAAQQQQQREEAQKQWDLAAESKEEEQQQRRRKEEETQEKEDKTTRLADEVARFETETGRILAEQKKLDLQRLQATLVTSPPNPKRSLLGFDKLAFLSRSRRSNANSSQPGTPSTLAPSIFSPAVSHFSRNSSVDDSPLPIGRSFIQLGGKGIVPQIDAPTSASNGGERQVVVRWLSSIITVPVTADTSPVGILQAAAEQTKHHISPATCVVMECYFVLGLERRLRQYERVRDILNSWDNDQQNSLLILSCDTSKDDQDLDLSSVPRTEDPPPGFSVKLYQFSRPGKWNKRWVTLLDNGQMFASKRPWAGPSDKDSTVVCHLSDFDIYAPKESEMRRNLKPPKQHCYAIKSQQKTTVLPNCENFVHFFCTDDDKLAARFYELVHGWRSWYLVNSLVDKEKQGSLDKYNPLMNRAVSKRGGKDSDQSLRFSIDKSGESLMDVSGFKAPDISTLSWTPTKRSSKESSSSKAAPSLTNTPKEREFSADGVLGKAYDKRRQNETANGPTPAPVVKVKGLFTEGPALVNGGVALTSPPDVSADKSEPGPWFPSATEHSAGIRAQSIHNTRRPLTANAASARREKQQPAPLIEFSNKDFINFAPAGGQVQQPQNAPPQRAISRRGLPALSTGPSTGTPLPLQQLPPGARARSRSTAGSSQGSRGWRFSSEEGHPPVPPLPHRSMRWDRHGEMSRWGPAPRNPEPS